MKTRTVYGIALLGGLLQVGCDDSSGKHSFYRAAIGIDDPSVRIRAALNCSDCEILNLSERMLPRLGKQLTAAKVFVAMSRALLKFES